MQMPLITKTNKKSGSTCFEIKNFSQVVFYKIELTISASPSATLSQATGPPAT
jgi:hypothetical protein